MPVRMDHDQSWTFPHQAHNQVDNLTITYFPQHDNDWTEACLLPKIPFFCNL